MNIAKYAFIAFFMSITYMLINKDKPFCKRAGISPLDFGAQHYTTFKQLVSLRHGYYEYDMTPEAFHDMRKNLDASGIWKVRTYPIFYVPQFRYSESQHCNWFFLQELRSCIIWMAYDEQRNVLYAGYYET